MREALVGGEAFAIDASLIKADANRQKGIEGEKDLPPNAAGRAIEEYLAVLDDAAFGAATEVTRKFISPSEPAARWTGAHGGQAFFAVMSSSSIHVHILEFSSSDGWLRSGESGENRRRWSVLLLRRK